jgi:YbgC/YbaW family acyl-CoA thioester hydrolase
VGGITRHRVEWGETDAAAIVYYPNYFRWFDRATHDLFAEMGYPISTLLRGGNATPLVDVSARFRSALAYGDEVSIDSRISEVRARTFRIEHTVWRGENVVCEGHEVRIWVRLGPDGSLVGERIPDELRAVLIPAEE